MTSQVQTSSKNEFSFRVVEGIGAALTLALMIGSFYFRQPQAVYAGVVLGALLGFANLRLIRRLVFKLTAQEAKPARMGLRFAVKLVLLVVFVLGFLIYGQVSAPALLLGFSTSVAAILIEGLRAYL